MAPNENNEDAPRRHGLQLPLDSFQYIALFAFVLFMLAFAILHAPLLTPSTWRDVVVAVFALWIPCCAATYLVAAYAPCHPDALDHPDERMTYGELIRSTEPPGMKACKECRVMVPQTCKHCYACDKCVEGFDHHCRWLNHCVGERNYIHFAVFLGNTFTLLTLQGALGWWLSIEAAHDWPRFEHRADRAFNVKGFGGSVALAVFLWLIAILELGVILVLGHLYFLHIQLNVRGITTYDMILIKRRDSKARKVEREALGIAPDGNDSPVCHALIVRQRIKELNLVSLQDDVSAEGGTTELQHRKYSSNLVTAVAAPPPEQQGPLEKEPSLASSVVSHDDTLRQDVHSPVESLPPRSAFSVGDDDPPAAGGTTLLRFVDRAPSSRVKNADGLSEGEEDCRSRGTRSTPQSPSHRVGSFRRTPSRIFPAPAALGPVPLHIDA